MTYSNDEKWNIQLSSEVEAKQLMVFLEYLYSTGYDKFYKVIRKYGNESNDENIHQV